MTYDLASILRESQTRRAEIILRPIDLPRRFETEFFAITRRIVQHWSNQRQSVLDRYDRELEISEITRDDANDRLREELARIEAEGIALIITLNVQIGEWISSVERWHSARFRGAVRSQTGFDPEFLLRRLSANDEIRAFQEWASGLIRDINADQRRRIEASVFQGFANQTPRRDISREIQAILSIGRRRAAFIARDQANKISGKFDELRHREAGIESYRWRTARDERVRDTHRRNQGRIFRWDAPPSETGHPRTEPNCRCTAEAVIEIDQDQ